MSTISLLPKSKERSVFEVSLDEYPSQPWSHAAYTFDSTTNPKTREIALKTLNQWFNYNFHPSSWKTYAQYQVEQINSKLG